MQALAEARVQYEAFTERFWPVPMAVQWIADIEGCTPKDAYSKLEKALVHGDVYAVDGYKNQIPRYVFPDRLRALLLLDRSPTPDRQVFITRDDLLKLWPPKRPDSPTAGDGMTAEKTSMAELRPASSEKINETIGAVYDNASEQNQKPPNVREIVEPVKSRLATEGLEASGRRIQELADDPIFKNRRRKPGATVLSEKRKQEH